MCHRPPNGKGKRAEGARDSSFNVLLRLYGPLQPWFPPNIAGQQADFQLRVTPLTGALCYKGTLFQGGN